MSVVPDFLLPGARWAEHVLIAVITLSLLQHVMYSVQLLLASITLLRKRPVERSRLVWDRYAAAVPPISLLVPGYNEEMGIEQSVRSMLALEYPSFEVIVINDGSKDRTLQVLIEAFGLERTERAYLPAVTHKPVIGLYASPRLPRLLVVDKENGGKSDALNAGINLARCPLFCAVDADSMLDACALLRVAQAFAEDPVHLVAAGGSIRVVNGCEVRGGRVVKHGLPRNLLALFQVVEYLRAYLMARVALSRIGVMLIISGAFGVFRRATVVEVGGYSHGTVGEDLELVVKLHRLMLDRRMGYRIIFVPEPACWTEVPESLRVLGRQRSRWQRGSLETLVKHAGMLDATRYGRIAWLGFGQMILFDLVGPVAEILGYILLVLYAGTGLLSLEYFFAITTLTFVFGVALSVGAVALQEISVQQFRTPAQLAIVLLAAIAENFGYRQLCGLWRMRGTWQYLAGAKSWGAMPRKGLKRG
jgi:cellulose synthase/poly-beta-1,6-N-acetylglucosamine synthase-like glycosyltransferase